MIGTATGCQSLPELTRIEHDRVPVTAPNPLPDCDWPELRKVIVNSEALYVTDAAGLADFLECRTIARTNRDVALGLSEALLASKRMHNNLLTESDIIIDMAELQLQQLEDRRQEAVKENWLTRGLLAVVLVAVAL